MVTAKVLLSSGVEAAFIVEGRNGGIDVHIGYSSIPTEADRQEARAIADLVSDKAGFDTDANDWTQEKPSDLPL